MGIEEQEEDGEPFEEKMGRLTAELSELFAKSHEWEDEIRKQAILFGSRARGDNRERSDIDLAISGGNTAAWHCLKSSLNRRGKL